VTVLASLRRSVRSECRGFEGARSGLGLLAYTYEASGDAIALQESVTTGAPRGDPWVSIEEPSDRSRLAAVFEKFDVRSRTGLAALLFGATGGSCHGYADGERWRVAWKIAARRCASFDEACALLRGP
jgi:hypothetical protein